MLCSKCKKNEAKIYYTEIINGQKTEQHLCEECAAEYTSFPMGTAFMDQELTLGSLLSSILGNYYNNNPHGTGQTEKEISCDGCGMTYSEFMKEGRFGCAKCYDSFQKILERSIKNIQGSDTHTGKKPKGFETKTQKLVKELSEIDKLTIKLQDAIEKEEFEEAAKLRDRIRELKKEEINNG
ncbi:MAG: DNA methylase [Lachnoclostridium sp.]|jgi:protein arginine kinase activator